MECYHFVHEFLEKLEKDKDKVQFLTALIEKQLFDRDPKDLTTMADFAYTSQKERIMASVTGFKTKNNCLIYDPMQGGCDTPTEGARQGATEGGSIGGIDTPTEHNIKDNNKEYKNIIDNKSDTFDHKSFLMWFNNTRDKFYKTGSRFEVLTDKNRNSLKELMKTYDKNDFLKAFKAMIRNDWVIENERVCPDHFLTVNNFQRYINSYGKRQEQPKRMQGR